MVKKKLEASAEQPRNEKISDSMMMDAMIPSKPAKLATTSESKSITLKFTKAIEVTINGILYSGKEIKVTDMETASEIVRIAKDAYGWEILE